MKFRSRRQRGKSIGIDHETVGGNIFAWNSRRRLWTVIRGGVVIAEAPTRADAELIVAPGGLFSGPLPAGDPSSPGSLAKQRKD